MSENLVEFTSVSVRFAETAALERVSFLLAPGRWLFLTGPSGAGKSTLLNVIAGVVKPASGEARGGGENLARLDRRRLSLWRRRLGVIPQDSRLLEGRSTLANVMLPLEIRGMANREAHERGRAALVALGLETLADRPAEKLSGGERRRAAVARALIAQPDLILADEPTADLDEDMAQQVLRCLWQARERGAAVILATHDRKLAADSTEMRLEGGRAVRNRDEAKNAAAPESADPS